jgi:hypothetical protein
MPFIFVADNVQFDIYSNILVPLDLSLERRKTDLDDINYRFLTAKVCLKKDIGTLIKILAQS